MDPTRDASSTNAVPAAVTSSYGPMNVVQRSHQQCPLPGVTSPGRLWALGIPLEMAAGMEAQGTMQEKPCAIATSQRSHGQYRRTDPTRAGCSIRAENQGSSSVASFSGPMKMSLHQVLLAADTTAVDSTVVRATVTEVETGERKREMPGVTKLPLQRSHVTAVSVIFPDTPESPVHSGDARTHVFTFKTQVPLSFNTQIHDLKQQSYHSSIGTTHLTISHLFTSLLVHTFPLQSITLNMFYTNADSLHSHNSPTKSKYGLW